MPICTRCGAVFGDDVKHVCIPVDVPEADEVRRPGLAIEKVER